MNDATPREVATQFGIAAALSFSAMAAPFVPEAILAYAGYCYLRHFTYRWRTWRAPARVPLHLGRRGYRDETTRRRGDASWPIGLAATGQVWLRREDLVQGLVIQSDDPGWHAFATANLVFGACLNRMGAIVVQGPADPLMTDTLAEVAAPFGRDSELRTFDLAAAPRPPLRIGTSTLASALADLGVGKESSALNNALLPVIEMLAARYRKNPLTLYAAFLNAAALARLVDGKVEIDGNDVANTTVSADGAALGPVLASLKKISPDQRETGRQGLVAFARELAGLRSISLTEGLDLDAVIAAGGLLCIRPSSPLTTALVVARCVEALDSVAPDQASSALIHIAYPNLLSGAGVRRFRATAARTGAIGSFSVPSRPAGHLYKAIRKTCAIRLERKPARRGDDPNRAGKVTSAIKGCSFALDVSLTASLEVP